MNPRAMLVPTPSRLVTCALARTLLFALLLAGCAVDDGASPQAAPSAVESLDAVPIGAVATLEGTLTVFHIDADRAGSRASEHAYSLRLDGGPTLALTFDTGDGPLALTGTRVRLRAVRTAALALRVASGLAPDLEILSTPPPALTPSTERAPATPSADGTDPDGGAPDAGSSPTPAEPDAPATVNRRAAIVLFNFRNATGQPYTPAQARDNFTRSYVNAYYREQSFGRIAWVGRSGSGPVDVYGWYTIDQDDSPCDAGSWSQAAAAAAQSQGVDLSGYDHVMYVFPNTSCWWAGMATVGGGTSWYVSDYFPEVTNHELGHNLGLMHANAYECTDPSGNRVSISDHCSSTEYGDPFDSMGDSYNHRHESNYQKGRLGWLAPENTATVTGSGTYTIAPIETSSGAVQSLRIVRDTVNGTVRYYYLESRVSYGFDSFASSAPVVNGVSIRLAPEYSVLANPQLIDTTPETATFDDAALAVGRTFSDPAAGLSITVTAVSPSGATVRVEITDTQPPTAAGNVRVTDQSPSSATLAWDAATDDRGVAGYEVYRSDAGGAWQLLAHAATPGYTDHTLSAGVAYGYRVVAYDGAGNHSPPSNTASTDAAPPAAPTGLHAASYTGTDVSLAWTAATDDVGVAGYRVLRATGSADAAVVGTPSATAYDDRGFAAGAVVRYRVVALDRRGNASPPSDEITVDTSRPSAPTGLARVSYTVTSITIRWQASSAPRGLSHYEVWRQGQGESAARLIGQSGSTTFTDGLVVAWIGYQYHVVAVDDSGQRSEPSDVLSAAATPPF